MIEKVVQIFNWIFDAGIEIRLCMNKNVENSYYHLRKYNELKVYYIKKDLLDLGVVELKDPAGNWVRAYDKERTICDIIKGKDRIELQVYTEVIQNYFKGKVKMNKLSKYAKELGISEKSI